MTICFDNNGYQIPCDGTTGQDGDINAGIPLPNPRFTDNEDGTVSDNLTGLVWLKDANCIQTNYPDFDNDDIVWDGKVIWYHALDFVDGINDGIYPDCGAGYTDWRLPNLREIHSLVNYGFKPPSLSDTAGTGQMSEGDPFINVAWKAGSDVEYWTSTTMLDTGLDSISSYSLEFNQGKIDGGGKNEGEFYVWPVRGPE